MVDRIEGLCQIRRHEARPERRLLRVKAANGMGDGGKKGGNSRMFGSKAVLSVSVREGGGEEGKEETLENLGGGAEETDGAVRSGEGRVFAGLGDR